jgi:hypothetical protein
MKPQDLGHGLPYTVEDVAGRKMVRLHYRGDVTPPVTAGHAADIFRRFRYELQERAKASPGARSTWTTVFHQVFAAIRQAVPN